MFNFRSFAPLSAGKCLIIVFASACLLLLLPATLSASAPDSAKRLSSVLLPAYPPSLVAGQLITPTLIFSQATVTVPVGSEFSVDISINDAIDLAGWQSTLVFDAASLEVVTIACDGLVVSTGRTVTDLGPWDESPGRLVFGSYTHGTAPAVSGSGRLAQIRLKALAAGTGTVSATQTILATLGSDHQLGAQNVSLANAQITAVAPLAVTLQNFSARSDVGAILATWETTSELNNQGFNLYRSTEPTKPQDLLTFIPAQAPGSAQGFAYEWPDLDVVPGQTYFYWLEDIDLSGITTLHGPVSATFEPPTAVTVADVRATAVPNPQGWLIILIGILAALRIGLITRPLTRKQKQR